MSCIKIEIGSVCRQAMPCYHDITATYSDGKEITVIQSASQILQYINDFGDKIVNDGLTSFNKEEWLNHFEKGTPLFKTTINEIPLTKIIIDEMCYQTLPCKHGIDLMYSDNMTISMSYVGARTILELIRNNRDIVEDSERWIQHFEECCKKKDERDERRKARAEARANTKMC